MRLAAEVDLVPCAAGAAVMLLIGAGAALWAGAVRGGGGGGGGVGRNTTPGLGQRARQEVLSCALCELHQHRDVHSLHTGRRKLARSTARSMRVSGSRTAPADTV